MAVREYQITVSVISHFSYDSARLKRHWLLSTGLDKALYAIAANYCQAQANQSQSQQQPGRSGNATARALWWNKKGKMPVDPSQWKYCELCKMTCPGDQVVRFLSASRP